MSGYPFTWVKGNDVKTASRLDRFLLSPEIFILFMSITQSSLPRGLSDHNPVLLKDETIKEGPRPFKWFSHWADEPGYVNMVNSLVENSKKTSAGKILREIKVATEVWVKEFQMKIQSLLNF
ncbi:hypothetical protein GQ457_02G035670 [Hibiscus cannabinus]